MAEGWEDGYVDGGYGYSFDGDNDADDQMGRGDPAQGDEYNDRRKPGGTQPRRSYSRAHPNKGRMNI